MRLHLWGPALVIAELDWRKGETLMLMDSETKSRLELYS